MDQHPASPDTWALLVYVCVCVREREIGRDAETEKGMRASVRERDIRTEIERECVVD